MIGGLRICFCISIPSRKVNTAIRIPEPSPAAFGVRRAAQCGPWKGTLSCSAALALGCSARSIRAAARLGGRTFQENVADKVTVLSAMHRQLFSSSSEP